MRRYLAVLLALGTALGVACGAGDNAANPAAASEGGAPAVNGRITVFAASSLTDAFTAAGREFEQNHPGAEVVFNFAASTTLRTQLEQGARADLYASADQAQMDAAKKAGVIEGTEAILAKNSLIVVYPAGNPGRINRLEDLANPGLKLVLTGGDVPAGVYARAALARMAADARFSAGFDQRVLANLRSEEPNVRAVLTKVQLGEADAGIVYASDVTAAAAPHLGTMAIPEPFNATAAYPIAVVRDARNREEARAFVDYVRSERGQRILRQYHFIVDETTGTGR